MEGYRFHHHPLYDRLAAHALSMNGEDRHLKTLIRANNRMADFSATGGGIFFDYSRQRVDATTMALLDELAEAADVKISSLPPWPMEKRSMSPKTAQPCTWLPGVFGRAGHTWTDGTPRLI
jgi:hypothetical protein